MRSGLPRGEPLLGPPFDPCLDVALGALNLGVWLPFPALRSSGLSWWVWFVRPLGLRLVLLDLDLDRDSAFLRVWLLSFSLFRRSPTDGVGECSG